MILHDIVQKRYEGTCPYGHPLRSTSTIPQTLDHTPLAAPPFKGTIKSGGTLFPYDAIVFVTGDLIVFAHMPYQEPDYTHNWITPIPDSLPLLYQGSSKTKVLNARGKAKSTLEIHFDTIISIVEWHSFKAETTLLHWSGIKPGLSAHDTMDMLATLRPLRDRQDPTLSGL